MKAASPSVALFQRSCLRLSQRVATTHTLHYLWSTAMDMGVMDQMFDLLASKHVLPQSGGALFAYLTQKLEMMGPKSSCRLASFLAKDWCWEPTREVTPKTVVRFTDNKVEVTGPYSHGQEEVFTFRSFPFGDVDLHKSRGYYGAPDTPLDTTSNVFCSPEAKEIMGEAASTFFHRALQSAEDKDVYYIQEAQEKNGDSAVWWGIDRQGYSNDFNQAGIYTKVEADHIKKIRPSVAVFSATEIAHCFRDKQARTILNRDDLLGLTPEP